MRLAHRLDPGTPLFPGLQANRDERRDVGEALMLEGAAGMWELSCDRAHGSNLGSEALAALLGCMQAKAWDDLTGSSCHTVLQAMAVSVHCKKSCRLRLGVI